MTVGLLTLIGSLFAWLRNQIQTTIKEQKDATAWRTQVKTSIDHIEKRLEEHGKDLKEIAEKADIASWKTGTEKDIARLNERLDELSARVPSK